MYFNIIQVCVIATQSSVITIEGCVIASQGCVIIREFFFSQEVGFVSGDASGMSVEAIGPTLVFERKYITN